MSRYRQMFMLCAAVGACAVMLAIGRSVRAQSTADSARAFIAVASVLASPRCANCHITGDAPLQGEEGRLHSMNVRRGTDGRGTAAMRCTNCHQETSSTIHHAPPGGPDWRLPPAATPMAWRGLSPGDPRTATMGWPNYSSTSRMIASLFRVGILVRVVCFRRSHMTHSPNDSKSG